MNIFLYLKNLRKTKKSFFPFLNIYFIMGMLGEIEKFMLTAESSTNYRILNLGGKSIYIEGIKTVVCFGDEEIQFQMKNGLLSVKGETLKVKYLDKTTCVILGEIKKVEMQ